MSVQMLCSVPASPLHLAEGPGRRGVDDVVAVEGVEARRVRVGGPEADRGRPEEVERAGAAGLVFEVAHAVEVRLDGGAGVEVGVTDP
jgi:hypothetical protein